MLLCHSQYFLLITGAGIAALGPIIAPVLRSMTSKLVSEEERGKNNNLP